MKRLFYFTGHRMRILHWSGKHFEGACSFEPDAGGFDKFRLYLESSAKAPTKLLIDVIEEDFRVETVPRVFGKDRKAVINRIIDRNYRSSAHFTYNEIIGREAGGRKDNRLLIGALTNPNIISSWLDIIDEVGVPLSGIWSLPLVSKSLLPVLDAKSGPVLLVSQQVNSNLRQTFFRDGKMISSRQSVINQDASDISNIGSFARPEVDRTILFLRNQQLIAEDEVLNVHVLVSDEQMHSVSENFRSIGLDKVLIHNVREIEHKTGFDGYRSRFADGVFAWLCVKQPHNSGHYDGGLGKERYVYSLASTALYAAAIVVLVFGLLLTESYVSSAIQFQKASQLLTEQEKEYRNVYRTKFEAYEEVFSNARVMNAAVDLARQIENHGKVSPLDLYLQLSAVIRESRLEGITIDAINWESEQVLPKKSGRQPLFGEPSVLSKENYRHAAIIRGRIDIPKQQYEASVRRIEDILQALQEHERIIEAEAIEMPVEVRSERKFTAESGVNRDGEENPEGAFSLRIVMQGVSNV